MNVCAFLAKMAYQYPDQPALVYGNEEVSYREFYRRALEMGGSMLARGLGPGDRVAFCLANSPRIPETIYACFAAGLIVVPINARLHAKEIAYIVSDAGARVLLHGPDYQTSIKENIELFEGLEQRVCTEAVEGAAALDEVLTPTAALREPVEVDPEDPCWLFYTSGTTGRPKGAIWSHRTVRAVIMNYLADVYNIQPGEVVLHAAPLSHGSGIVALPAVSRGATNAILDTPSFSPRRLFEVIERMRVSHIAFMAPTQIVRMLEEYTPGEYDLSSLRAICYGGAPIYLDHLRKAIRTFGPVFAQIYGQGEAPMTIAGLSAKAHARLIEADDPRLGSAGTIRTDVEARCVDPEDNPVRPGEAGEVVARGDVVMLGYWNNAEATAETLRNGWLHTGDIGYFDETGYLFLLDRAKDVIITGGNNVYPREVEEVIATHPGVANVVVCGVPHDVWGEAVQAVVIPEPGANVTADEIIDHCGDSLAGYKKPKAVDFVDELPVSGYGKVLRREIQDQYWKGTGRRISGGSLDSQ